MKKEDKEFLKQVEKLVYEQMKTKHVNCDTVCESMNITNQHLRRKILAITGTTGGKYILTIRMKYAKELLAKGKYSVGAVALKCGYDDANNFSRTFKREVGKKPTEYASSIKQLGVYVVRNQELAVRSLLTRKKNSKQNQILKKNYINHNRRVTRYGISAIIVNRIVKE